MRWPATERPKNGDIRTIDKFLFFPKCVNGEWRWLEKVIYQEVRDENYGNYDDWDCNKWSAFRWIDKN
jgi:hypothetical protein